MLAFFLGYNVVNQRADTTQPSPAVPSYYENNMCGLGDNPECTPTWSTTTPAKRPR